MDASRFSGWTRPARRLPFVDEFFRADVAAYHARGIHDIASFAVWLDADYVARHGPPPIPEFGAGARLTIHASPAEVSDLVGQKRRNMVRLEQLSGIVIKGVHPDATLSAGMIRLEAFGHYVHGNILRDLTYP